MPRIPIASLFDDEIETIRFFDEDSQRSFGDSLSDITIPPAGEICLSEEEKQEQALLRQEYLAAIRQSLEAQLDNVYIVEKDGTQTKLKKKEQGPLS